MERTTEMPVGVVVERRAIDHPWQKWRWRPVEVIPGAPAVEGWRELVAGPGWTRYHAATLPLTLHRSEAESYRDNLAADPPRVYVVLRSTRGDRPPADAPYRVPLVTASPYEAQAYINNGDDVVEGVPMPEAIVAWLRGFVERHYVERPFLKRKRSRAEADPGAGPAGRFAPPPPLRGNGRG